MKLGHSARDEASTWAVLVRRALGTATRYLDPH